MWQILLTIVYSVRKIHMDVLGDELMCGPSLIKRLSFCAETFILWLFHCFLIDNCGFFSNKGKWRKILGTFCANWYAYRILTQQFWLILVHAVHRMLGVCQCKIHMSKKDILPEVIFTADVKHYLRNTGLVYVKIKNNRICQKGKIWSRKAKKKDRERHKIHMYIIHYIICYPRRSWCFLSLW